MTHKKQDKQDVKQDIKQEQKSRIHCEAGQAGHLAHVYRENIFKNAIAETTYKNISRTYSNVFHVLLVLFPLCLLSFTSCFMSCLMSCLSCFSMNTGTKQ